MDLAHRDRRVGQVLEHLTHHHNVEAGVLQVDGRSEVHLLTGYPVFAGRLQGQAIDVNADPGNEVRHVDEHAALATNVDAETFRVVPQTCQVLAKKRRLC